MKAMSLSCVATLAALAAPGAVHDVKTVPLGGARVGFTLDTTAKPVMCSQMKSLSVLTNGNVVTAVWKGHPVCGDNFTVTAKMRLIGGHAGRVTLPCGFEYIGFEYAGNESGQNVRRISFPEVTVPRTDATAIFRPNTVDPVGTDPAELPRSG